MKSDLPHQLADFETKIYAIRGKSVLLDSDLADLNQVKTKVLNQAVKRNLERFPEDFMFRLTEQEFSELQNWSQIVTSSRKHRGGTYRPYVFTEHGAVMFASVLRSDIAIKASVEVVRAFVKMRGILSLHRKFAERIENLEETSVKYGHNFAVISELLSEIFKDPKSLSRKIGFIDD